MLLPLAELAVTGAIPSKLTTGAPLSGCVATLLTDWVLHEILEHLRGIQLDESVHVVLLLL